MKTYNINDNSFKNSDLYKDFLKNNPGEGTLRIRAYAASGAIPISNLKVVISTTYLDNEIIFFDGITDESGTVPRQKLPAPTLVSNNLDVPNKTIYKITATYTPDNITKNYNVNMYDGICVVQNINIVPDMTIKVGDF